MSQDARYEFGGNAELASGPLACCCEATNNRGIRDVPFKVSLWVEKDLGVDYTVSLCLYEILPRQGFEVGLLD